MCSQPRQSLLVSRVIGGLTKHTTNLDQKPSLRRANEASLSSTRSHARVGVFVTPPARNSSRIMVRPRAFRHPPGPSADWPAAAATRRRPVHVQRIMPCPAT
ncbi:hypothetical protein Cme02nite_61580 [Catellatospora methionotrophica]|uniref:Uncharacterized protein n=1 Tax=Catellatospora methionotrophica TaxID=121620 RepID=A0A8J3LM55_9ACTN|nr:hypothetical protein Cme02nite_61580 [Catellatospora methionotrophica]